MSEIPRRLAYGIPEAASMLSISEARFIATRSWAALPFASLAGAVSSSPMILPLICGNFRPRSSSKEHRLIHHAKRRRLKAAFAFSRAGQASGVRS